MRVVVKTPYSCFFDHAVHALNFSVCPRVVRFRQTVIIVVSRADQIEANASEGLSGVEHDFDVGDGPSIVLRVGE